MINQFNSILVSFSILFCSFASATATNENIIDSPKPAVKTETSAQAAKPNANPQVILKTSMGEMTVELFQEKSPETVKNFLKYVDGGFYNGVIFHRIIPSFMVQTGGFNSEYYKKNTSAPIINESRNLLKNLRGTLSMARTNSPDSATAQFFINLVDNPDLDFKPGRIGMPDQEGYAVFGRVIKGIETIDKMAEQPQGKHRSRGHGEFVNAPNNEITIDQAYRVKTATNKEKAAK